MKKHYLIAMVVGLCVTAGLATAADPYSTVSADEMGRAFLSNPATTYQGWFESQRMVGPVSTYVQGNFSLNSQWYVTQLEIDGQVVVAPGDEPLAGLPENGEGSCANFNLGLTGLTAEGMSACWGDFHIALLRDGDPILVELRPTSVRHLISFALPAGVPAEDVAFRLAGQYDWPNYYNVQIGGFDVWTTVFNPSGYEIFNVRTGEIYRRGTIGDNDAASQAQSVLSAHYVGGIQPLFENGVTNETFDRQTFPSTVMRDEVPVPAKVYIADLQGQGAGISVYNGLALGSRVEVLDWRLEGEMPLITWSDGQVYPDGMGKAGWVSYNVSIPAGYGKVVIVVWGNLSSPNGFSLCAGLGGRG